MEEAASASQKESARNKKNGGDQALKATPPLALNGALQSLLKENRYEGMKEAALSKG